MRCPFCDHDNDKVIDSRSADEGRVIRRRRLCNHCDRRFTTYERIEESVKLTVIKRDGSRMPYTRQKILSGLQGACYKRPVAAETLQQIVDEVEETLFRQYEKEVDSEVIGRMVSEKLRNIDQVAYVRFASVYKRFGAAEDFLKEVEEVMSRPPETKDQGKLF